MKRRLMCMVMAALVGVVIALSGCDEGTVNQSDPNTRLSSNELPTLPPPEGTASEQPEATEPPTVSKEEVDKRIKDYVELVRGNKYTEAFAMHDQEYAQSIGLTQESIQTNWEALVSKSGKFVRDGEQTAIDENGYYIYSIPADYENNGVTMMILMDTYGRVAETQFQESALSVQVDAKDLPASVAEKNLTIGKDSEYPLNAKLTYPAIPEGDDGVRELPLFVLVPPTNAHDMDYTSTYGKMYKTLAYELASSGYAVLRYDNWTFTYPMALYKDASLSLTFSTDREVVRDAIAARTTAIDGAPTGLKFSNVYAVGHYFAGMLIPQIVANGSYDGGVILAASPSPFLDVMYQYYKGEAAAANDEEYVQRVEAEYKLAKGETEITDDQDPDFARSKGIEGTTEEDLPYTAYFGYPAYYMKNFHDKPVAEYFKNLQKPLLILTAEKDNAMNKAISYDAYKKLIEDTNTSNLVTLEDFEDLNAFFTTNGPSTTPGEVPELKLDSRLLSSIQNWAGSN